MGWGCYKHECDIGSEKSQEKLAELVQREEDKGFPSWGRDAQICPFCYEEMENELHDLRKKVKDMEVMLYHAGVELHENTILINNR